MSWVITIIEALVAVALINIGMLYYIIPSGPYGVGHRQTVLKGKTTPPVSVFYPIHGLTYKNHKNSEDKTSPFLLDGMKDIQGISNEFDGFPTWLMRDFCFYRLKAVNDANLHSDFKNQDKKLTPVIVSHDLAGNRTSLAATVSQLASHGCIVYCINHTDGSASYFKNTLEGKNQDVYYEKYDKVKHKCRIGEFRNKQLTTRVKDIQEVVEFIKEEANNEELPIDLSKLTALGHGLGGLTALEVCYQNPEVFRLCVALDPNFSAKAEELEDKSDYALSQPLLILTNDEYPDSPFIADYDHKKTSEKVYKDTCEKNGSELNHNLVLETSSHLVNSDIALYYAIPFKMIGLIKFATEIEKTYTKSRDVIIAFLNEHQCLPVEYEEKIKAIMRRQ